MEGPAGVSPAHAGQGRTLLKAPEGSQHVEGPAGVSAGWGLWQGVLHAARSGLVLGCALVLCVPVNALLTNSKRM